MRVSNASDRSSLKRRLEKLGTVTDVEGEFRTQNALIEAEEEFDSD